MIDKETEQEENPHVGRIRPTDLIVDDDANFEYHLDQDEFNRMVERNRRVNLKEESGERNMKDMAGLT